jgi:transcriptional regulator with XRE-family HTH domain
MKLTELLTDDAILHEIGERITAKRVALAFTQEALASKAGIGKRTVERLEAGHPVQTTTLIRVLRVLDGLKELDIVLAPTGPRPSTILKEQRRHRPRQRVRHSKTDTAPRGNWQWEDEK